MITYMRQLPNQLTAVRFVIVPIMWVCAFLDQHMYIGIGFTIGFVTDLLDGAIARKLNQTSEFGSKFDSLADQFIQISSIFWILMLMPEIFSENLFVSLLAIVVYITSLSVGLIKFKRMANLHLYLSKAAALFLYIFLIHTFIVGQYSRFLFILAGILFILSSTETLILQLILPKVDEHIGSIFLLYIDDDHPVRYWLSRLP